MKRRYGMRIEMSEDLDENITSLFQRILPFLSSLVLLLLSYVPLDFSLLNNIRPSVGIVCVYFWMLHRPDLFNLWSVYFLGMIDDIISASPFGSNIMAMLLMYILLNNTSRFFNAKPFIVTWYGFAALALVTMLSRWLVVSVYYGQFLPLTIMMFSYLVTVASYPLLSLLLAYIQNHLIQDEE